MINLFIPIILPIGVALIFSLFKEKQKNLFAIIIIISVLFNILVYSMRLPFSYIEPEILTLGIKSVKTGVMLELSALSAIFSILISFFSVIFMISELMINNANEKKILILALMTSFALMSVQSVELLHFILFIFILVILFIVYAFDSIIENSFSVIRFLTGLLISLILLSVALGINIIICGSGNISQLSKCFFNSGLDMGTIMFFTFTLSLLIFIGVFPMNILSYDFISSMKDREMGVFIIFISFPSIVFMLKCFSSGPFMINFAKPLFLIFIISFIISILAAFERRSIQESKYFIISAVISETLAVLFYGLMFNNKMDYFYLASNIVMLVFIMLSLEILKTNDFEDMKGSFKRNPFAVILFLISSFSISFIPPSLGFISKYEMISNMISAGDYLLSIVIIILFALETFIFLKILFSMFFIENTDKYISSSSSSYKIFLVILVIALMILGYSGKRYFSNLSDKGYTSLHERVNSVIDKNRFYEKKSLEMKQFIIE